MKLSWMAKLVVKLIVIALAMLGVYRITMDMDSLKCFFMFLLGMGWGWIVTTGRFERFWVWAGFAEKKS